MKISLITTTKDRPDLLLECAKSVAAQTYQPFEWIIYIDDLLVNYYSTIPSIRQLFSDTTVRFLGGIIVGRVEALDIAHSTATGDYFALLDDDDWLESNCLQECYTRNTDSFDIIYTDYYRININNQRFLDKWNRLPYTWKGILQNNIMFRFKLYKAILYKEVGGYNIEYEAAIDYEFTLRMLKLNPTILKVNLPLYNYKVHNNSLSGTNNQLQVVHMERARSIYRQTFN